MTFLSDLKEICHQFAFFTMKIKGSHNITSQYYFSFSLFLKHASLPLGTPLCCLDGIDISLSV
jgi:hypothetical protein